MTEAEFDRYQKAVEIKDKIDTLQRVIEYIDYNFNELVYPRSESGWELSITLNDKIKSIHLTSELFWECVNLVKQRKLEKIQEYQEQFNTL